VNIGRNDQCPCNGGKKYKNCHMNKFTYPKEKFNVMVRGGNPSHNFHMEQEEGSDKWIAKPGNMSMRLYYTSYQDDKIEEIMNKFKPMIQTNNVLNKILTERHKRLKHKLYGTKFHYDNFIEEESVRLRDFNDNYIGADHELVMINPKLLYEMESFLFQISTGLDIIVQIISILFKFKSENAKFEDRKQDKINTMTDGGERIIKLLQNNVPEENKIKGLELSKKISRHKMWIADTIDMRNDVTHFSDLEGFSCFIQESWKNNTKFNTIYYPSMPDGKRARTYLENTWTQFLNFIEEIIPYLNLK
jgi:hypothetical protein